MAYFPDVTKGDEFKPSALLSNNVRRLINGINGFGGNGVPGTGSGVVRIQVYNNAAAEIPAGSAVNFSETASLCGDAVPAEVFTDAAKTWGVITAKLAVKQMGDCIVSGPATVAISGDSGKYASPNPAAPATFTRGESGSPILFVANGKGIILLGGGSDTAYDGPFKVGLSDDGSLNISAGFLNRNGEFSTVAAKTGISPAAGYLCLSSTIEDGVWTEPEYKITTPAADAYPVAEISVDETGNVSIRQYQVVVAIILLTKTCPLTKE